MLSTIQEKLAGLIAPKLVERRNELERLVNFDHLTRLANRFAFEKAEPKARRDNLAFILFDANNFGRINKLHGHDRGDEILKRFANVIANVSYNFKARAFRLGGDEFVVICLHRFAPRVRDEIERRAFPIDFGDFTVSLTGEIGTTVADADERLQERKVGHKARRAKTNLETYLQSREVQVNE